jgi:protoporphyrinogen oxidase
MLGQRVVGCEYDHAQGVWAVTYQDQRGEQHVTYSTDVISSAPMRELTNDYLKADLSSQAIQAAASLKYRDFLIVILILPDKKQFDDNWIYIHDPSVDVGRIQNFKSWSPEMVPDAKMCCYGLEYFCFEGDGVWDLSDAELIAKATKELAQIGLADAKDIVDGCVVRQVKAYPVYDEHYKQHVEVIRHELETKCPKLHLVGRNGMHKYNNQDHAMMTGILTAKNIMAGQNKYDVWNVNQDAEYHESGAAGAESLSSGLRAVPERRTETVE